MVAGSCTGRFGSAQGRLFVGSGSLRVRLRWLRMTSLLGRIAGLQKVRESGTLLDYGANQSTGLGLHRFFFFGFLFCDHGREFEFWAGRSGTGGGWARGTDLGWGRALGAGRDFADGSL